MSPLWEKLKNKQKRKGVHVEGNSKSYIDKRDFAQNLMLQFFGIINQEFSIQNITIKGISLHIATKVRASMTLEAALVLPLFMLFFLQVGGLMEIMRFHGRVETALWETGRETCLYGSALSLLQEGTLKDNAKEGDEVLHAVGNVVLSYTYVKNRVENYLGRDYLESAPLIGGGQGLQYLGSGLLGTDDEIEIVVTYLAKPKWALEGTWPFVLENHYVGRLWTGYDISDAKQLGYFLAENTGVYHRDRECTHLKLEASLIGWNKLDGARNNQGKKYRACSKCITKTPLEEVWVSPEGECFHSKRDCPGLKRTVREVSWEEASKYRPCSRCGGRGGW